MHRAQRMRRVKVTATNQATGYVRTLATDATGFYSFQTMPIGKYTVKVEQPGFATVQEDVVLNVGEKGRQDFPSADRIRAADSPGAGKRQPVVSG